MSVFTCAKVLVLLFRTPLQLSFAFSVYHLRSSLVPKMQFKTLNPKKASFFGSGVHVISQLYYGLGNTATSNLFRSIGISPQIRYSDIPPHQLARIKRILNQKVTPIARDQMERDFVAKVDSGEVGAGRTVRGYPAHGQEAKSNADTQKRLQPYFQALVKKHSSGPKTKK